MSLPVDTIIEAGLVARCCGQRVLNVFHYRVKEVSALTQYADEMDAFISKFAEVQIGSMMAKIIEISPGNWELLRVTAQAIHPTRLRRITQASTEVGSGENSMVSNLQASITTGAIFAGRQYIGGKRFLIGPDLANLGVINSGAKVTLGQLADTLLEDVQSASGGGVYGPVIFHRNPATTPRWNDLYVAFPQDTVRVLRRRTVGLGE